MNRLWLQGDESIHLDSSTCAMTFRLLRVSGYDVSSGIFCGLGVFMFISFTKKPALRDFML